MNMFEVMVITIIEVSVITIIAELCGSVKEILEYALLIAIAINVSNWTIYFFNKKRC
jgi:hypothetical protein